MTALADALTAAQAELPASIKRGAEGQGYRYVTLDALLEVVRPILNKHGIILTQWPSYAVVESTLRPTLTTRLETTDEVMEYDMPLYVDGAKDMQALGSAITYARRYAIQAALGIAAETDDDAVAASGKGIPF